MTVGKDVSASVFWRSMKTVQRWRQKASHFSLEVQPLRRLDRRLFYTRTTSPQQVGY